MAVGVERGRRRRVPELRLRELDIGPALDEQRRVPFWGRPISRGHGALLRHRATHFSAQTLRATHHALSS